MLTVHLSMIRFSSRRAPDGELGQREEQAWRLFRRPIRSHLDELGRGTGLQVGPGACGTGHCRCFFQHNVPDTHAGHPFLAFSPCDAHLPECLRLLQFPGNSATTVASIIDLEPPLRVDQHVLCNGHSQDLKHQGAC